MDRASYPVEAGAMMRETIISSDESQRSMTKCPVHEDTVKKLAYELYRHN